MTPRLTLSIDALRTARAQGLSYPAIAALAVPPLLTFCFWE